MIIKESEYITSLVDIKKLGDSNLKEIAFFGRSNVGKSSLINALTNRKNLARTSANPGKTQTLNFYLINKQFYLVDFPGYGYAKTSKAKRDSFSVMINSYLKEGTNLVAAFLLVDYKVGPTNDDINMYKYLVQKGMNVYVILTKADKLKQSELVLNKRKTASLLGIEEAKMIPTSSETKRGIDKLLEIVEMLVM